jgi:hypothetical protein
MKKLILFILFSICYSQVYITNNYGIITNKNTSYIFSYSNVYYASEDVMYSIANDSKKYYDLLKKYKKLSNRYKELDKNMSNQISKYKILLTNEKIKSKIYKEIVTDTEDIIKITRRERRIERFKKFLYYFLGAGTMYGAQKLK